MEATEIIKALEELNYENILFASSKEAVLSREIIRFKAKLSEGILWYPLARYKKRRAIGKIPGVDHPVNWDEKRWRSLMHEGDPRKKTVVYSCIAGDYDSPQRPLYYTDCCDYIMYMNTASDIAVDGWTVRQIPNEIKTLGDNTMINRYIKMHPTELFEKEYDYAVYIDGNIRPVTDLSVLCELIDQNVGIAMHRHCFRSSIYDEIEACLIMQKGNKRQLLEQKERYKREHFPDDFGMAECNVIATDLHSEEAKRIADQWWKEFCATGSGRDQISLPYVLWKMDHTVDQVTTLGDNVSKNPKLRIKNHEK